uniref:Uncharacterized protein n=1 Tax=Klebsiella pneumoniae TaxID=573 RepID=A0A8B0SP18_KLEPN|nr:hypothetical protein [Klebsiella pneumoniae]
MRLNANAQLQKVTFLYSHSRFYGNFNEDTSLNGKKIRSVHRIH